MNNAPFWTRPLASLSRSEWEALCDGCGKCCLHKVEEEETGHVYPTNVACKLLDTHSGQCSHYRGRHKFVPECLRLTPKLVQKIEWLPFTCAYRLRAEGLPLPEWHYLVCGDREAVHRAGESVRGWTVTEGEAGDLEHHLIDRPL